MASHPKDVQAILQLLSRIIRMAAPGAEEVIRSPIQLSKLRGGPQALSCRVETGLYSLCPASDDLVVPHSWNKKITLDRRRRSKTLEIAFRGFGKLFGLVQIDRPPTTTSGRTIDLP